MQLKDNQDSIANIKVSISCLAYNHSDYIRKCLESFLMQKTNFSFEVIIHDDASTDNTASIIKEYEDKFPKIIKPIYQKENQYSKGVKPTAKFNFPRCKGKYIALCEGDDYWTDPLKLQKQVDFLENNTSYGGVANNSLVLYDNGKTSLFGRKKSRTITEKEIIRCRQFATASILFKNNLEIPKEFSQLIVGDTPLMLLIAKKAPIYYENIVTSVYRRGGQGITSNFKNPEIKIKLIEYNLYLNEFTNNKYSKLFRNIIRTIDITYLGESKLRLYFYLKLYRLDKYFYSFLLRRIKLKEKYFFDIAVYPFYKKFYFRIFG